MMRRPMGRTRAFLHAETRTTTTPLWKRFSVADTRPATVARHRRKSVSSTKRSILTVLAVVMKTRNMMLRIGLVV